MIVRLLDVNVLLALQRPSHDAHRRVYEWFRREGQKAFSTCSITQTALIRLMTNPLLSERKTEPREARRLLDELTQWKGHTFLPADVGFLEATKPFHEKIHGHRQVTDAYLLGLAIHEKGTLVTLDKAIRHLAGDEFAKHILLIGENA